MARPVDPDAQYRVKLHSTNGYTYASTQPPSIDPETGKKKYRYVHWGSVVCLPEEDGKLKFIPGSKFYQASPEERTRLIFPEDWDMSEAEKLTGLRKPGRPAYTEDCQNRLYGDVWLLEHIASITGIRQDLEVVFNGNSEMVNDILTLAMFPYLTQFNYSRVARWQRAVSTPSSRELTSTDITRLTQSITEQHRMDLLKLRAARLDEGELCAVDSTSRSAYGSSLADIRWGKNKEGLPLQQTNEIVVYTLSSHMPVYYRTFPGNMPDSRTIGVILKDLEHAGFKDLILITDRGFDTLRNLEKYILRGQSMILCVKTNQREVMKVIQELGEFNDHPEEMTIDPGARMYHKQYDIDFEVKSTGKSVKAADRLKLNLYFDPIRRSHELMELQVSLALQKDALAELLKNKGVLDEDNTIKRDYCYYKVVYDPATRVIESFELNEKKVTKARSLSGFFAIMTHGVDFDAMKTLRTYQLRDEQEKYFGQMKSQMMSNRQRNWSEEGKTGRLLILFVSLILSSYVRYIWKSTRLCDLFSSSLDILDEMRPIRLIEHTNRAKVITPFVGAQVDICQEFGIQIPEGCSPEYVSRKKPKRRRGRPPKKTVHTDF
ncbi:MAG: transposase [Euryarchaeota archaeon]|nr:transposase [Euryarchaeota archaeon]